MQEKVRKINHLIDELISDLYTMENKNLQPSFTSLNVNLYNNLETSKDITNLEKMSINELNNQLIKLNELIICLVTRKKIFDHIAEEIIKLTSYEDIKKSIEYIHAWFNIVLWSNSSKLNEAETTKYKIESTLQHKWKISDDSFNYPASTYYFQDDMKNKKLDNSDDLWQFQQTIEDIYKRNKNLNAKYNTSSRNDIRKELTNNAREVNNKNMPNNYLNVDPNTYKSSDEFHYQIPKRSKYISLRRNKSKAHIDEKIYLLAETPENMNQNIETEFLQCELLSTKRLNKIQDFWTPIQEIDSNEKENSLSFYKTSALEKFNNLKFERIDKNEAFDENYEIKNKEEQNTKNIYGNKLDIDQERYLLKDKINKKSFKNQ